MIGPFAEQVALLDTIPGIDRRAAEVIVAEIGVDMEQFPTAAHRVPAGPAGGATRLGGRTQAALAVAASTASARELQNPAVVLTGARAPITDRLRALPSARTLTLTGFATELLHLIAALAVVPLHRLRPLSAHLDGDIRGPGPGGVLCLRRGRVHRRPDRPRHLQGPDITARGLSCFGPRRLLRRVHGRLLEFTWRT